MPVQGFTRLRKHIFGRQSAWGNAEPGTRAYPFDGVPTNNLNWTDPEGDFGSLFPIAAPYRTAPDLTASLTAPVVNYNDLPLMLSAMWGGDETPTGGGTAKTWTWTPNATTPDDPDLYTYQFGDDVLTDWFQLLNGTLTQLQFSSPDDGGQVSSSMDWLFSTVNSTGSTDSPVDGTVPTPGLDVDANGIPVYAKDTALYINDSAATIGNTQITEALHSYQITMTAEIDQKRYHDGTQSFEVEGWGRSGFRVEVQLVFGKTADTVGTGSESDAWMSDTAVNRFVRLKATSTELAQAATPYSWTLDLPLRYYTREEGEIGGNSTVILTGTTFLETATLDHAFSSTVVNTLTATGIES